MDVHDWNFYAAKFIQSYSDSPNILQTSCFSVIVNPTSFPGSIILPPKESEERPWLGLVTCHFNNWEHQGGTFCNQQYVALSFVEFKVSHHDPLRLSIFSFQAEVSNNIYSNVYLKVKQVWRKAISWSWCSVLTSYRLDLWKVIHIWLWMSRGATDFIPQ